MSTSFHLRSLGLALVLAGAAGCSSPKTAVYEHENFDDSGTFSRNYPVSDIAACEAARRALLSQGYIINTAREDLVDGQKSFQPEPEAHLQIAIRVVCAPESIDGKVHALAENTAPKAIAQVNGILTTLFKACQPALRTPWCCAWSMRDMAMHTELVKNTSTKMVMMALPTAAGPSKFNSNGKPM